MKIPGAARAKAAADRRLIADWGKEIRRLWSIRVALFWGAMQGIYSAWPAAQALVPPLVFITVSMVMSAAIVGARLMKQDGGSADGQS